MKGTQILKTALTVGVGGGVLSAILNYFFGWYGPQTLLSYVELGLACGLGGAIGEALRKGVR